MDCEMEWGKLGKQEIDLKPPRTATYAEKIYIHAHFSNITVPRKDLRAITCDR